MSSILDDVAVKRCTEISDEIAQELWYCEIQNELIALQNKIGIDKDMKALLNQYDKLCLKLQCKTEELIYIQAFKDGVSSR